MAGFFVPRDTPARSPLGVGVTGLGNHDGPSYEASAAG